MAEKSRIRFNPETKEIEIEGTEKFVKTYFAKIQKLLLVGLGEGEKKTVKRKSGVKAKAKAKAKAKKVRTGKKAGKAAPKKTAGRKGRRGDIYSSVVKLITESSGIGTAELVKKTGLTEKQIWSVIYRAEKLGKVKKEGRGIYVAV